MTNEVQDFGPKGCPFLGLEEDRSVMLLDPSPLHRCHAIPNESHTPALQYQADTCLCPAHTQCPRFLRAQPIDALTPPPRRKRRSQGRTPMVLAAITTLLTVAAIGWLVFAFLSPSASEQVEVTPGGDEVALVQAGAETPAGLDGAVEDNAAEDAAVGDAGTESPAVDVPAEETPTPSGEEGGTALPATPAAVEQEQTPAPAVDGAEAGDSSGDSSAISLFSIVTPTPNPGNEEERLRPSIGNAGWWREGAPEKSNLNDSFLYTGRLNGENYLSAVRFDLSRIPRGAPIAGGKLVLTGLRDEQLDRSAQASWLVQIVSESDLASLTGSDFMMVYSAPASITLLPQLTTSDLQVHGANTWVFDANTLRWLEDQRLAGAESLVVRIIGDSTPESNVLFGWDSGLGSVSSGAAPTILLEKSQTHKYISL